MTIESLIEDYLDHLNDGEYVRRIFASQDAALVALTAMIGSRERSRVVAASLVLQDAVLHRYVPGLRELLPRTEVMTVLRANLHARHYITRRVSVFALGKLTYSREAAALIRAFPVYLERYPLELTGLLGELFWQSPSERKRRWHYFDAVARAPHHMVRWSVFEAAGAWSAGGRRTRDGRLYVRLLRRLAQDPHPFVRSEARERLDSARRARDAGTRWPGAWEFLGDASFATVEIRFGNYLWVGGRDDYDLELLDRFAHYVISGAARAAIDAMPDRNDSAEWDATILDFDLWQRG